MRALPRAPASMPTSVGGRGASARRRLPRSTPVPHRRTRLSVAGLAAWGRPSSRPSSLPPQTSAGGRAGGASRWSPWVPCLPTPTSAVGRGASARSRPSQPALPPRTRTSVVGRGASARRRPSQSRSPSRLRLPPLAGGRVDVEPAARLRAGASRWRRATPIIRRSRRGRPRDVRCASRDFPCWLFPIGTPATSPLILRPPGRIRATRRDGPAPPPVSSPEPDGPRRNSRLTLPVNRSSGSPPASPRAHCAELCARARPSCRAKRPSRARSVDAMQTRRKCRAAIVESTGGVLGSPAGRFSSIPPSE